MKPDSNSRKFVSDRQYPIADLSVPPFCKCGTRLGRSGKCPALCEPAEQPSPKYIGPAVVGGTHIGNIARRGDYGVIG